MGTDVPFDRRPIGAEQFEAWLELLAAVEAEDREDEHHGPDDLREYLADPYCDFARGSIAFYDGPTMIGYGYLTSRTEADPVHEMYYLGGVHPAYRGRGVGAALLAWAEQAALPLHLERYPDRPLTLYSSSLARNTPASELYAAHGYTAARWFHGMTRDLLAPLPDLPAPDGIEVRGFTAERSEDARLVRNEAFRDHWGSTESSEEGWAHMTTGPAFRPGLSFVAYDVEEDAAAGGEALGIVLGEEYDAHTEATGRRDLYVSLVGTRRAGRKRGIASALLVRAMAEARETGFATASLGVDADSPTGALGLYEHVGFTVKDSWIAQLKPIWSPVAD
ncbi:GNAT family N-acetyltransferase [Kitasatospora sp. DSM 101779]|uniref:GNAT family N-acetyltransferase n=1 Tax=Kitasatospora sp. DSM 101779 TaxID=2853165 RepID=UPI0021DA9D69|nr:GNAT family N-acetyltransferase [Kitasatospora sp. DSM 101779]MCU7826210.1 GNAT family N-acetyltransferase [Kitasatospora sp. DSM 101779]